ncbi:hypothetical protein C8F04DRAFT_1258568 [Mycena alexandri]|uniref:Uncharacterized protein n=1 Tax=Mycena alexandri TaxID=1745969 RepID=A0AAD6SZI9_9AGAR|nr:hypothetical protein C8F04DRAFT_1258568 [Mycena alexandri]
MDGKGNDPLQRVRPSLQARRIRVIAISLPILLLTGYTLFERLVNQPPKNTARPIPGRNATESLKAPGGDSKEETW